MSIPTIATLFASMAAPHERVFYGKSWGAITSLFMMLRRSALVPTASSTAVACNRTTSGAVGQQNSVASTLRLVGATGGFLGGQNHNTLIMYDRLSHMGGLVGNIATTQTTNLPTAALTRYTSGVGVRAAVEIYSQVGGTPVNLSVSYTNSAGTPGQTSPPIQIGGTFFREESKFFPLPWASGDEGVRSVESLTLTGSTGTVGSFGLLLYKPLVPFVHQMNEYLSDFNAITMGGFLPVIEADACLDLMGSVNVSSTMVLGLELRFGED